MAACLIWLVWLTADVERAPASPDAQQTSTIKYITTHAWDVELACDVHHAQPVVVGVRVDLLGRPQELHVGHVHARGLPNLRNSDTVNKKSR